VNEWNYKLNKDIDPHDIVFGARKRVWWVCPDCDYEYQAMVYSRTGPQGEKAKGCAVCANRVVHPDGRNSLAVKKPEIASEWHPDNPDTPHNLPYGSNKRRKWICSDGHEWTAGLNTRLRSGCRICAKYGFNPKYPASIYVLEITTQVEGTFYKAGITNQETEKRISQIRRSVRSLYDESSVTLLNQFRFVSGKIAEEIEVEILSSNDRYIPREKIDGRTECFSSNPLEKIEAIIEMKALQDHMI
jgi:hypothetical protein